MKKIVVISFTVFITVASQGAGFAEIKAKAHIPNINRTPSLHTLKRKIANDENDQKKIDTNGTILQDRNIIVDDIEDPKCVFYGNYNDTSSDAEQYFDIDTIIFECE